MNPQQLPYYIAGAEALLGLASRHFGAAPAPAPKLAPPPAPPKPVNPQAANELAPLPPLSYNTAH